jgi:hypothetical protein
MKPSDMVVYDNSMRPSASQSIIKKFADLASFGYATPMLRAAENQVGVPYMTALMHTFRSNAEGGATGAILAAISASGGLVKHGVPVDLAAALVGDIAGVLAARSEFGITFRQVGASAMTVFMFRMTEEWLGVRKKSSSFAGDDWNDPNTLNTTADVNIGDDPIIATAQSL